MHMSDALVSIPVGISMAALSAGALAYSISGVKKDKLIEQKVPLMAISGAMVFAAQMINFTIPGTGSSGHIGGGILLAGLIGGFPALVAISCVLIIQCLFFADGGLLALGCNIFNMGVIPCLFVYPLIFRPLTQKCSYRSITLASVLSVVIALQLGAFSVVAETWLSGITEMPFSVFLLLMQSIHLAIGLAEGLITASVLSFIFSMRPEILTAAAATPGMRIGMKKVIVALALITVLAGGLLSLCASANPDGLEWSIAKVTDGAEFQAPNGVHANLGAIQSHTAFLPDYAFADGQGKGGTSVSGLLGSLLTFLLAGVTGFAITIVKKAKTSTPES